MRSVRHSTRRVAFQAPKIHNTRAQTRTLHTTNLFNNAEIKNRFTLSRNETLLNRPVNFTFTPETLKFATRQYSSGAGETIKVPSMGESITEGTIQEWLKKAGDYVEADEVIAQIETDKVVVDVRAPSSGMIQKLFAEEGDNVEVDQDLFILDTSASAPEGSSKPEASKAEPEAKKEPVKEEKKPEAPKKAPQPAAQPAGSAREGTEGLEQRVKMSRMRQRIAQRLKESQNTYAMLTTFNEVDMSALMELRSEFKENFEKKHGIKLGFMSAFVKAATAALKEVPAVNAVIDGDEVVYRDYCDVGVAVSTPTGLVVPVLRNCQEKSFAEIEADISGYGKKARENRISLDDMQGGTFTISNGGVFGSLMGTPIINPPQSAILGMHAIKKRPVAVGDKVEVRPMMYLALTYDHRLIDGKEAVTFLVKIKECIEDPRRLLLDL